MLRVNNFFLVLITYSFYGGGIIEAAEPANHNGNPLRGILTWTDVSGKHHFEASLVNQEGKKVELKGKDAKVISIELNMLSDDNKKYLNFLQQTGIEVFDELTCDDQIKRQGAANRLLGTELPSITLPAVSKFIDLEIRTLTNQQNFKQKERKKVKKIPFRAFHDWVTGYPQWANQPAASLAVTLW